MEKIETLKSITEDLLKQMGVRTNVEIKSDNQNDEQTFTIDINGDDLNYLIGYRGQSLDALQDIITHIYYKKTNEWPSVLIDINGYTAQRIERLQNIAKRFIDRVRFFQTEVELPAMSPWERKQVHKLVGEYGDVTSESKGEGRNRKLYLLPKKRSI